MYLKKNKIFKHIDFIILDFLCMEVSFVIAYYIRHRNFLLFEISSYRSVLIILIVASLFTCYYFDSMKDVIKRSKQLEFYATIRHIILTTFILIGYIYITQIGEDISRNTMIIFPIFYLILSYIFRLI